MLFSSVNFKCNQTDESYRVLKGINAHLPANQKGLFKQTMLYKSVFFPAGLGQSKYCWNTNLASYWYMIYSYYMTLIIYRPLLELTVKDDRFIGGSEMVVFTSSVSFYYLEVNILILLQIMWLVMLCFSQLRHTFYLESNYLL